MSPFNGKDRLGKDTQSKNGNGGWIKLQDDVPQRVTILGYVGTTTSKRFPEKVQYRFQAAKDGVQLKLDANWRLMKALNEQIDALDSPFEVTITQTKVIAEIPDAQGVKSKKLVNDYSLKDVVAVDESPF